MSESTVLSESTLELLDNRGYTSIVYRLPGTQKVCKVSLDKCRTTNFLAEKEAYERFAARKAPPTILRYYGVDENNSGGLLLELAENGSLRDHIWRRCYSRNAPSLDLVYRWARQAAEALTFAHSCGVFHADIHCSNFFLDSNFNLKVADFAGASIDGSKSWSCYRYSHRLFEPGDDGTRGMEITVQSEIFALGSAIYAMLKGQDPFQELEDTGDWAELVRRVQVRDMPDTSQLPALGSVIEKCWHLEYASMREVLDAIEADRKQHLGRSMEGVLDAIEAHRTPTQHCHKYQQRRQNTSSSCSSNTPSSASSFEEFHLHL